MAYDLVARAIAKWRPLLVYLLLWAVMQVVTDYIAYHAPNRGMRLYGLLAGIATSVYCLIREWQLLTADEDGDDAWPRLWS